MPNTTAGTKLSIGTTIADPTVDTYIEVSNVLNYGEFGRKYNSVKYTPVGNRATQKLKGSFDDGTFDIRLAKDAINAGQQAVKVARDTDFSYNFKIEANDKVPARSATVTVTIAAPGIFTDTAHGLVAGDPVKFTTTGALPTGLTAGTTYYVTGDANLTTNAYAVSATRTAALAGTGAIATTGTQSGVHTRTTVPINTVFLFKAQVMSYTTNFSGVDDVTGSTMGLEIQSGSIIEQAAAPSS